ncbi:hypothetical protein [Halospeciosus flavus]|uniref:Glycerophosphoryl diester phosphodiesterase membrane domain-containing protein n=1 Tax=Halospeciosus flavus TaxID=3032283 RepID=A0ABD5Z7F9_9EURY|nr:hypothetical protein [Halospeciosus flavus]
MSHSDGSVATPTDESTQGDAPRPGVREGIRTVRTAFVATLADPWLSVVAVLLLVWLGVAWSVVTAVWALLRPVLGVGSSLVTLFLAVLAVVCVHATFSCYAAGRAHDYESPFWPAVRRVLVHLPALAVYAAATTLLLAGSGVTLGVAVAGLGLPPFLAAVGPFVVLYAWLVGTYYWTPLAVRADEHSLLTLARENWRLVRHSWRAVVTCQAATLAFVLAGSLLFAAGVGSLLAGVLAVVRDAVGPLLAAVGLRGPLAALLGVALGAFGLPILGAAFPLSRSAKLRLFHRTR